MLWFSNYKAEKPEKNYLLLKNSYYKPKILAIGSSSISPGQGPGKNVTSVETKDGGMEQYGVDLYSVDFEFFPTMGMELTKGRNFSNAFGTDSTSAVIINQAMASRFGWDDPIGKKFQLQANDTLPVHRVIGVVKDFHQVSLYDPITPILFYPNENNSNVHLGSILKIKMTYPKLLLMWSENGQKYFPVLHSSMSLWMRLLWSCIKPMRFELVFSLGLVFL